MCDAAHAQDQEQVSCVKPRQHWACGLSCMTLLPRRPLSYSQSQDMAVALKALQASQQTNLQPRHCSRSVHMNTWGEWKIMCMMTFARGDKLAHALLNWHAQVPCSCSLPSDDCNGISVSILEALRFVIKCAITHTHIPGFCSAMCMFGTNF